MARLFKVAGPLSILGLALACVPASVAATLSDDFPKIQVLIEGVDPSDYPRIKIYFRVLDTNPETRFRSLDRPDVKIKIHESLPDQEFSGPGVKPIPGDAGNNFKNPDINELATSFVVDRSASIESVIGQIGRAIDTYAGKLKVDHLGKPLRQAPRPDDIMNVIIFSGPNESGVLTTNYTDNASAVEAFTARNFVAGAANGTPYYNALEMALSGIEQQQYLKRTVIVISDGRQAVAPLPDLPLYDFDDREGHLTPLEKQMMGRVEHLAPPRGVVGVPGGLEALLSGNLYLATRLGERAAGYKVPMFSLGFSRIEVNKETGQFARVRILEEALRPLVTDSIGGAFFRPRNPLPEIPDFPGKKPWPDPNTPPTYSDAELNDASLVDDEAARTWIIQALSIAKNEAAEAGGKSGPLPDGLKFLAQQCLYNSDGTYPDLAQDFEEGIPELDNLFLITKGHLRAAYNDLVLKVFKEALDRLSGDNGTLNTRYYRELSDNLFDKIRYSLKNTFYVVYDSPSANEEDTSEERRLRLTVSYVSPYKGRDEVLTGSATAPFKKPVTIPEDSEKMIEVPLDGVQPALELMSRASNPRGGPWIDEKPTLNYQMALWAEVERPGEASVRIQLAVKPAGGEIALKPQDSAVDGTRERETFNRLTSVSDGNKLLREMYTYLESAVFDREEVQGTGTTNPKVVFYGKVPTPSLSKSGEILVTEPTPGSSVPKILKLWYLFSGRLERSYEFNGTQVAIFDLPSIKFEIRDCTKPSVAVRFESDAQPLVPENSDAPSVSYLWVRETPVDAPKNGTTGEGATYEYGVRGPNYIVDDLLQGDHPLTADPSTAGLVIGKRDEGSTSISAHGTSVGYFVRENTRLRMQVLSKDNFIWQYDHSYLSKRDTNLQILDPAPEPGVPNSNAWDEDNFSNAAASGSEPPFLARAAWEDVQSTSPRGGVSWRLVQDGEVIEEVPDTFTFRAANYNPPEIGKPYELQIKASDGNDGNLQQFTIPIWVVPAGFNVDVLRKETKVETTDYKDGRGPGL